MKTVTLLILGAAALVAAAGCGKVEGRVNWRDGLHTGAVTPPGPPADAVFPVPPAPFSPGAFPCSRCHAGGTPAQDTRPAIPHALHLERGMECGDCHFPDDDEPNPKIPSRETCDTCHGDPEKLSDGARAYFGRVTAADGTTAFPRRWETRDVRPEHVRHVGAGVACAACHGEPANTPFVKPKAVPLMDGCIACHQDRGKTEKCQACHEKTTERAHAGIVLHHAQEQRGCLDCHDADDRDRLRLANGQKIEFAESFRLCGQCHGTQFRDWKVGLHGKRTGEWNGRREYRLCVHCHYPHEPRFPPMTPVAKPIRPEEVR